MVASRLACGYPSVVKISDRTVYEFHFSLKQCRSAVCHFIKKNMIFNLSEEVYFSTQKHFLFALDWWGVKYRESGIAKYSSPNQDGVSLYDGFSNAMGPQQIWVLSCSWKLERRWRVTWLFDKGNTLLNLAVSLDCSIDAQWVWHLLYDFCNCNILFAGVWKW
jgi:hypothetical protein